jgi:hypothetical protein
VRSHRWPGSLVLHPWFDLFRRLSGLAARWRQAHGEERDRGRNRRPHGGGYRGGRISVCRPMGGESIRISAKGDFLYMHPWLVMLDVDEMARIGSDRVLMACGSAELEIESCWVDVTRALDQSEPTATPRQAPLPGVFPSVQAKLVAVEEKKVSVQVKTCTASTCQ